MCGALDLRVSSRQSPVGRPCSWSHRRLHGYRRSTRRTVSPPPGRHRTGRPDTVRRGWPGRGQRLGRQDTGGRRWIHSQERQSLGCSRNRRWSGRPKTSRPGRSLRSPGTYSQHTSSYKAPRLVYWFGAPGRAPQRVEASASWSIKPAGQGKQTAGNPEARASASASAEYPRRLLQRQIQIAATAVAARDRHRSATIAQIGAEVSGQQTLWSSVRSGPPYRPRIGRPAAVSSPVCISSERG